MSLPKNPKIEDLSEGTLWALRNAAIAHQQEPTVQAVNEEFKRRGAKSEDRKKR